MPQTNSESRAMNGLTRVLGFWSLTLYGIGDILGAGIYALIGAVAAAAGPASWLSFLVAMLAAGLTGLSYSELVARMPQSAGESAFALRAFRSPIVAFLIGWLVFCSGVVSMSTVAHACAGYAQGMWVAVPAWVVWLLFVGFVTGLNFRGIRQSSTANIAFTLVEASGLLLAILAGAWFLWRTGTDNVPALPKEATAWGGVMDGAALAFFAYIGFEDMINVAKEVQDPKRNYPRCILAAVVVCGATYLILSVVAVGVVPPQELAAAKAPLLEVVRRAAPAVPPALYTLIALIAVANTGLLNSIMASRLLYGLARQDLLSGALAALHPRTRTPHWAILAVTAVSLVLIWTGTLMRLASTTSLLLLIVFIVVNAALIRIRWRDGPAEGCIRVPLIVPVLAIAVCVVMLVFVERDALMWRGWCEESC